MLGNTDMPGFIRGEVNGETLFYFPDSFSDYAKNRLAQKAEENRQFMDNVDNYAGYATRIPIDNGVLYQLEGSLNGVSGRFEWIIQDGQATHRMFIQNGTINGAPIRP